MTLNANGWTALGVTGLHFYSHNVFRNGRLRRKFLPRRRPFNRLGLGNLYRHVSKNPSKAYFSRNCAKAYDLFGMLSAKKPAKLYLWEFMDNQSADINQLRSQAIVDSLASFCHAMGQPATVLLSSVELLKMDGIDEKTRGEVLDVCYDAVLQIKNLLAEMKNRREYLAEAYLNSTDLGGTIASMPEWSEQMPMKKPPAAH